MIDAGGVPYDLFAGDVDPARKAPCEPLDAVAQPHHLHRRRPEERPAEHRHRIRVVEDEGVGGVLLHEALAVLVDQEAALAPHPLGDQHPLAGDAGGVELIELHVHQGDPGAQGHGAAVAGVDVGVGVGAEDLAAAAGGEQGRLGLDQQGLPGLDVQDQGPAADALLVPNQVQGEELVEEVGARPQVLLIEGVQDGVARTVRRRAGARRLIAPEVLALTPEGPLVDLAVVQPGEGHARVLQLVDGGNGLPAHELDGVLVPEIVRALDGIEHVPVPVVRQHIGQGRVDPALGGHRVGARREDLGDHGHPHLGGGELQGGVQTGAAGPDDEGVEMTGGYGHGLLPLGIQAMSPAEMIALKAQRPEASKTKATRLRRPSRSPSAWT